LRQKAHVASQGFYKQSLAKLCQDRLSPCIAAVCVCKRIANGILKPLSRLFLANVHLEHPWQSRQEQLTQTRLADHEPAYNPSKLSSAAHPRQFQLLRKDPLQFALTVQRVRARAALEGV